MVQSRRSLEEQETVAQEMSHRLKNLFTVADSMVHGSARSARTPAEMADALSGRLHALASAHSLVRRKVRDSNTVSELKDLGDLVRAVLGAHGSDLCEDTSPFEVEGPAISCSDRASSGMALIFHELATNSFKYGALSAVEGRVAISWEIVDSMLHLQWIERGGPPILSPPSRTGFGSRLMQRTVEGQFKTDRQAGVEAGRSIGSLVPFHRSDSRIKVSARGRKRFKSRCRSSSDTARPT